jgi:PAS domain S-box-containing protein
MPTMDGCEFVRHLRTEPAGATIPVIFCTATYREHEARALAAACGVKELIVKPANPEAVLQTVARVMGTPLPAPVPDPAGACGPAQLQAQVDRLRARVKTLEAANQQLSATIDLGRQLFLEHDPLRLVETYCEEMRRIVGARVAGIGLLGEDDKQLRHFVCKGVNPRAGAVPPPDPGLGLVRRLLREHSPCRVADIAADPSGACFVPPHPRQGSFLGVAIASASSVYGLLYLMDKLGGGEFSPDDERFAVILAALVGVAYRSALHNEAVHRQAARLEREVAERRRAEARLQESENRFRAFMDNSPAFAFMKDEQGTYIYVSKQADQVHFRVKGEFIGRTDFDLWPADVAQNLRDNDRAVLASGQALALTEMVPDADGSLTHWLVFKFPFRDNRGRLLLGGVAVNVTERVQAEEKLRDYADRLQTLSRRLVRVQEEERRLIARELHDEIGQILTSLGFVLDAGPDLTIEDARKKLNEGRGLVDSLLARVRELSVGLRPPRLDHLGLRPALLQLFECYSHQTGVRVGFSHEGIDRRFPAEAETAAYRVIQEALTNVARHAQVKEVRVRVWAEADMLGLQVQDQGVGFDSRAVLAGSHGSGLTGISERVGLLNGDLLIESAPGTGTQLTAQFPLQRAGSVSDGAR